MRKSFRRFVRRLAPHGALRVLALGSGHLLYELELLEVLRSRGRCFSTIYLVDPLYAAPAGEVRRALETFKAWFEGSEVAWHGSLKAFRQACQERQKEI